MQRVESDFIELTSLRAPMADGRGKADATMQFAGKALHRDHPHSWMSVRRNHFIQWSGFQNLIELHTNRVNMVPTDYEAQISLQQQSLDFNSSVHNALGPQARSRLREASPNFHTLTPNALLELCDSVFDVETATTSLSEDMSRIVYRSKDGDGVETGVVGLVRQVCRAYERAGEVAYPAATERERMVTKEDVVSEWTNGNPTSRTMRRATPSGKSNEFQPRKLLYLLRVTMEAQQQSNHAAKKPLQQFKEMMARQSTLDIPMRSFLLMARTCDEQLTKAVSLGVGGEERTEYQDQGARFYSQHLWRHH